MPQVLNDKINTANIQEEIKLLRSFVIGIAGKDKEGEYRAEFVKKIFRTFREKPRYVFKDKESFLRQLRKKI